MTTTQAPESAFRLDAAVSVGETANGVRRFRGIAHSGRPFRRAGVGNMAVDLATLKIERDDLPVLRDHDDAKPIGWTQAVHVGAQGLAVEGVLTSSNTHGREVVELLELGMPLQMSVYVPGDFEVVRAGQTARVNGHTLRGPGQVLRRAHLREVTITTLGADEHTSAALLSRGGNRGAPLTAEGALRARYRADASLRAEFREFETYAAYVMYKDSIR